MVLFLSNYLFFYYYGLLYIIFCLISFAFGFKTLPLSKPKNEKTVQYSEKKLMQAFLLCLAISTYGTLMSFFNYGISLSGIFDINQLSEMGNEMSVERYSGGDANVSFIDRFAQLNGYISPLMGGYIFLIYKKKYISFAPLLLAALSGLSHGVKMGIITAVFMWLIGYALCAKSINKTISIKIKTVIGVILGSVLFFGILLLSMMTRIGTVDFDTFQIVTVKFVSYSLGHLPAFDWWFSTTSLNFTDYTFGGKLLYGITNTLGILKRDGGIYQEMPIISKGGDSTNVFTVFRFFVEDFGIVGSFIFMFLSGVFVKGIYNLFVIKERIAMSTTIMFVVYFFISWSFVTSVLAYGTYLVLPIYFYIILRYAKLKTVGQTEELHSVKL